jgi:hypothetical protein
MNKTLTLTLALAALTGCAGRQAPTVVHNHHYHEPSAPPAPQPPPEAPAARDPYSGDPLATDIQPTKSISYLGVLADNIEMAPETFKSRCDGADGLYHYDPNNQAARCVLSDAGVIFVNIYQAGVAVSAALGGRGQIFVDEVIDEAYQTLGHPTESQPGAMAWSSPDLRYDISFVRIAEDVTMLTLMRKGTLA